MRWKVKEYKSNYNEGYRIKEKDVFHSFYHRMNEHIHSLIKRIKYKQSFKKIEKKGDGYSKTIEETEKNQIKVAGGKCFL